MGSTPVTENYVKVPNDLLEFLRREMGASFPCCALVIEVLSHRVGRPLSVSFLARRLGTTRQRVYDWAQQLSDKGLMVRYDARAVSGGSIAAWSLSPMWDLFFAWQERSQGVSAFDTDNDAETP